MGSDDDDGNGEFFLLKRILDDASRPEELKRCDKNLELMEVGSHLNDFNKRLEGSLERKKSDEFIFNREKPKQKLCFLAKESDHHKVDTQVLCFTKEKIILVFCVTFHVDTKACVLLKPKERNFLMKDKAEKEILVKKKKWKDPYLPYSLSTVIEKEKRFLNSDDDEIDFPHACGINMNEYEYGKGAPEEESKKNNRFDHVDTYEFKLLEDFKDENVETRDDDDSRHTRMLQVFEGEKDQNGLAVEHQERKKQRILRQSEEKELEEPQGLLEDTKKHMKKGKKKTYLDREKCEKQREVELSREYHKVVLQVENEQVEKYNFKRKEIQHTASTFILSGKEEGKKIKKIALETTTTEQESKKGKKSRISDFEGEEFYKMKKSSKKKDKKRKTYDRDSSSELVEFAVKDNDVVENSDKEQSRSNNLNTENQGEDESSNDSYNGKNESNNDSYKEEDESSNDSYKGEDESSNDSYQGENESSNDSYKRENELSNDSYNGEYESSSDSYKREASQFKRSKTPNKSEKRHQESEAKYEKEKYSRKVERSEGERSHGGRENQQGALQSVEVQTDVEKEYEMILQNRVMEESKDMKNVVESNANEEHNGEEEESMINNNGDNKSVSSQDGETESEETHEPNLTESRRSQRLLDPLTTRIIVSRDVVFDEQNRWRWNNDKQGDVTNGEFTINVGVFGNRRIQNTCDTSGENETEHGEEGETEHGEDGGNHAENDKTENDGENDEHGPDGGLQDPKFEDRNYQNLIETQIMDQSEPRKPQRNISKPMYLHGYVLLAEEESEMVVMSLNDDSRDFDDDKEFAERMAACDDENNNHEPCDNERKGHKQCDHDDDEELKGLNHEEYLRCERLKMRKSSRLCFWKNALSPLRSQKGGSKLIVKSRIHVSVFITKCKEDAYVTKNLVLGEAVYNEKRPSVQNENKSPLVKISTEKIEAVDVEKKSITVTGITPKEGGSLWKWSCEFEKTSHEIQVERFGKVRDLEKQDFKLKGEIVGNKLET